MMTLAGALAIGAAPFASMAIAQTAKPANALQFVTEQPSSEWLAHVFFGAKVQNTSGEVIGDINDLVFNRAGQINTVVLGVGGLLGIGENDVAVPYSALSFKAGPDGARIIVVALSKEELKLAQAFKATEKTSYEAMKDKAVQMGKQASQKAVELKDQAVKKVEGMTTEVPKKP
jgi:hypothetical protein